MAANIWMPPFPGPQLLLGTLPLLVLSESGSRSHAGTMLFKMLSSVAFILGPLLTTSTEWSPYRLSITTGLFFSLVGDFFLLPSRSEFYDPPSPDQKKGEVSISFQLGVVAFALAHIAYIVAFLRASQGISANTLATTFIATMVLAKWLGVIYPPESSSPWSNLLSLSIAPDMKPLVLVYALIISAMFAVALATTLPMSASTWLSQRAFGAAMFVISDLFVAKDAFGKSSATRKRGWLQIAVGYGLYFWGQMVIAGTVEGGIV
ncbi:lysoplasmalogenase [Aspergillus clavatus NRRL 1]|uniref:YhhN domain protein n=1 Tax=Aspergillus clavatus (strain ATCC 1007 / CBS 513.65 / DSM 816 / NCTC 3887 / NRRL 1 / QM 1276 / 107) TaxID=344612 RepID=A1CCT3_ASPCL|nr:YhhN domain protein [Aspergillus clavatus NRRL 1]EAW12340.1 YhhN domain protein [Aspergillus clavatus NRRL 1]